MTFSQPLAAEYFVRVLWGGVECAFDTPHATHTKLNAKQHAVRDNAIGYKELLY